MFHYIKKDFQHMLQNEKKLLTIIFVVQIISVMVVFFSYGVINHYNTKVGVLEDKALSYEFQITDFNSAITQEELMKFYSTITSSMDMKFERIYVMCENMVMTDAGYDIEREKYCIPSILVDNVLIKYLDSDYEIEDIIHKFEAGESVALVGSEIEVSGNKITVRDEEYTVIGKFKEGSPYETAVELPFNRIPEKIKIINVYISFTKPLLEPEYNILADAVKLYFDDKVEMPEFNGIKNENEYRVYRSVMVILVIFILMCGVDCCVIYSHLLDKRRKMYSVSRVCGCTEIKAIFTYLMEIMIMSSVPFAMGLLIFIKVLLPMSEGIFEYMKYYLDKETYLEISAMYFGVLIIVYFVTVVRFVKKTPLELVKGV